MVAIVQQSKQPTAAVAVSACACQWSAPGR
jgi:hypothetical protein